MATAGDTPRPSARPPANASAEAGHRQLIAVLQALTVLSGLVDAVCFLGLGRVFTANMTGNVVVLGFAAAGAPGFSVVGGLISLSVFLVGAGTGGALSRRVSPRSRLLRLAIWSEVGFVGGAAVVAFLTSTAAGTWGRYLVIAILAFAMGIRNSVIRRLGVPDLSTTVLTSILTNLAADSFLAGGSNVRAWQRAGSAVAMLAGAIIGAVLYLHQGVGVPLAVMAGSSALIVIALSYSQAGQYLDRP